MTKQPARSSRNTSSHSSSGRGDWHSPQANRGSAMEAESKTHTDECRHCHFVHVKPEGVHDVSAGFLTRELAPGVYMLTNGNYQSVFMTTGQGVVLVDAPEPLAKFIETAVADV